MSDLPATDTIFALSSGRGRAGVAVIRISGPLSASVLSQISGCVPSPRQAAVCHLSDPASGEPLDDALVLFFEGPASFTGEDITELHLHGGIAVIEGVLATLSSMRGLRAAEPGEFARRAFQNGKIDLTQAEGLADLIEAETSAQRRQALSSSSGSLKALCDEWRTDIIKAASMVEAAIDFSDEADVPQLIENQALPVVTRLAQTISSYVETANRGERVRDGVRVVLAGAPNAGKSSLLNMLSRRDVAIISGEAGTTRDVLEVHLDLDGYPVVLMDTAGVREASGEVEREGIRRTLERAREADLVLWLIDANHPVPDAPDEIVSGSAATLRVLNKIDLTSASSQEYDLAISVKTGDGIPALLDVIAERASDLLEAGEPAVVTRVRQRRELESCVAALGSFVRGDASALELRAEDLRIAAHALGRVTGAVDVEDILDRIFGDFCIGK